MTALEAVADILDSAIVLTACDAQEFIDELESLGFEIARKKPEKIRSHMTALEELLKRHREIGAAWYEEYRRLIREHVVNNVGKK